MEGSFLSIGVHRPPSLLSTGFGTQARICFDRSQPTSCLKNSFVFSTLKTKKKTICQWFYDFKEKIFERKKQNHAVCHWFYLISLILLMWERLLLSDCGNHKNLPLEGSSRTTTLMNECRAQAALVRKGSNLASFHTSILIVCALMLFLSLDLYSQGAQTVLLRNRGSCKTRISFLVLMFPLTTPEAKPSNSGHTYYTHILLTQTKNYPSISISISG